MKPILRHITLIAVLAVSIPSSVLAQKTDPANKGVLEKLDQGGPLYFYANIDNVLNDAIDNVEMMLKSSGTGAAMVGPFARAAVKALGLDQLHAYGASLVEVDSTMNRLKTYLKLKESTGIFELRGGSPRKLDGLAFIPADVVFAGVAEANLKVLIPLVERAATDIAGPVGKARVKAFFDKLNSEMNVNVPKIVESLGAEHGGYLRLDRENMVALPVEGRSLRFPMPSMLLMVQTTDRTLYDAIAGLSNSGKAKAVKSKTDDGLDLLEFAVPDNPLQFKPVLAFGKGWTFLASSRQELERAINAAKQSKDIRSSSEYRKLAAGLPDQFNGMIFVSPRVTEELAAVADQLAESVKPGNEAPFRMLQDIATKYKGGVGIVAIRVNDPEGILNVSQGDVRATHAFNGVIAVPATAILAAIAVPNFLEAQTRARVSRVRADARTLATGLEAHLVDHNAYPKSTEHPAEKPLPSRSEASDVPSFADASLTTPVSYMTTIPHDVFTENPKWGFAYYAPTSGDKKGWILWSPGPDRKFDLDWRKYDPAASETETMEVLSPYTYDPTNGTVSPGDIIRIRQ